MFCNRWWVFCLTCEKQRWRMLVLSLLRALVKRYRLRFSPQNSLRKKNIHQTQFDTVFLTVCCGSEGSSRRVLPVAEFFGQVDVQDVRQDGDELSGVTESSTDGVSRINVVHLCGTKRSKVTAGTDRRSKVSSWLKSKWLSQFFSSGARAQWTNHLLFPDNVTVSQLWKTWIFGNLQTEPLLQTSLTLLQLSWFFKSVGFTAAKIDWAVIKQWHWRKTLFQR